jgi:hypothetical protein
MPIISFTKEELEHYREPVKVVATIREFVLNICGDVVIEIITERTHDEVIK